MSYNYVTQVTNFDRSLCDGIQICRKLSSRKYKDVSLASAKRLSTTLEKYIFQQRAFLILGQWGWTIYLWSPTFYELMRGDRK